MRTPTCSAVPVVTLLFALAACGGDGGRSPPVETLVYLVTSCRQTGPTMTLQQELRTLRGEVEAATVASIGPFGPFPSLACAAYGFVRAGFYPSYGPVQRFGITPDGSGIVYELSDEFAFEGGGLLPPEQQGIYYVRADGSGGRRLGPASRSPTGFPVSARAPFIDPGIAFNPSGQEFAYIDRGPDEEGQDAAQVFVQRLTPGAPRQVTRLPALGFRNLFPENGWPLFIDAQTIYFTRWTEPRVSWQPVWVDARDGKVLSGFSFVELPGGQVIPVFRIVGEDWIAGRGGPDIAGSTEVWVLQASGNNVLQLTNFGRDDTVLFSPFYSARDRRVYFTASADPFGTNPTENCQIFSIDPIGRELRQLTSFRDSAARTANGCWGDRRHKGCRIDFNAQLAHPTQDPDTGAIFFHSSCNPLDQNPNGWQLFAIQPDGSGLRQLTNARGAVRGAHGTADVETVEFFWNAPY